MRPWDYHPDLTRDRLILVAQLLALGRGHALDRFDPEIGDDSWTRGVCAFNYGRHQIKRAAGTSGFEWLSVPDPSRRLQFKVGEVILRFYRGAASDPAPHMLLPTELEQFMLPLEEGLPLDGARLRVAVETDAEGAPIQISFVAIRGSEVETIWPIPYEDAPPLVVSLSEDTPEGVDPGPPPVSLADDEEVDGQDQADAESEIGEEGGEKRREGK